MTTCHVPRSPNAENVEVNAVLGPTKITGQAEATAGPPSVSWRTHAALGTRYMAGCPLRILGATVDSYGVLTFERNERPGCFRFHFRLTSATDVIVVAVPRRILPQRFAWDMTFVWDGWLAGLVRDEGPGPASRSGVAFDLGG